MLLSYCYFIVFVVQCWVYGFYLEIISQLKLSGELIFVCCDFWMSFFLKCDDFGTDGCF